MKILIVDNDSKHTAKIVSLLKNHDIEIIAWNDIKKDSVDFIDCIVLSGSYKYSVVGSNKTNYDRQRDIIKSSHIPIIGICVGFQLIVETYGGVLNRRDDKIEGIHSVEAITDSFLFENKKTFQVYESHRWTVDKLPAVLEGLAKSDTGWEIVIHKEKEQYGFQFHPEVIEPENEGNIIFSNLLKHIENNVHYKKTS